MDGGHPVGLLQEVGVVEVHVLLHVLCEGLGDVADGQAEAGQVLGKEMKA